MEMLITCGVDVNKKDKDGWTPLHYAANRGHVDVVKILLKNKADKTLKTNDGGTALDWASNEEIKQLLQV